MKETERGIALTVEGQIAEYGSEEIHGEHAEDGNIANILHSSLGWALGGEDSRLLANPVHDAKRKKQSCYYSLFYEKVIFKPAITFFFPLGSNKSE